MKHLIPKKGKNNTQIDVTNYPKVMAFSRAQQNSIRLWQVS